MATKEPVYTTPHKGPSVLPLDVLHDIVGNRGQTGARDKLAKKHGISTTRVVKIWNEYYGGGKISDYQSGLKKPLPTKEMYEKDNAREVATPRGKYKTAEPILKKDTRATPRIVKKTMKRSADSELDLSNLTVGELPAKALNAQANLLAGQVNAGNNNADLLAAIHELLQSQRDMLTRGTVSNLVEAQNTAIERGDLDPNTLSADPDLPSSSITKEKEGEKKDSYVNIRNKKEYDDSTKLESETESDFEYTEDADDSEEWGDTTISPTNVQPTPYGYQGTNYSRDNYSRSTRQSSSLRPIPSNAYEVSGSDSKSGLQLPGNSRRAKPIHKVVKREPSSDSDEEYADTQQTGRSKQTIRASQQIPVSRPVQSDHKRYNYQHNSRPNSTPDFYRQSRDGFSASIQVPQRTFNRPY